MPKGDFNKAALQSISVKEVGPYMPSRPVRPLFIF